MNIPEIQQKLRDGYRVKHTTFTDNEYIEVANNYLVDEAGNIIDWNDFWGFRKIPAYKIGWYIIEHNTKQKRKMKTTSKKPILAPFLWRLSALVLIPVLIIYVPLKWLFTGNSTLHKNKQSWIYMWIKKADL